MYNLISDFIKEWESESRATLKILRNLTDESLVCRSYNEGRPLGRIAWHITSSVSEMGRMLGLDITGIDEKTSYPSAAVMVSLYEKVSDELSSGVTGWNDEMLMDELSMYGENWTRGFTLQVLIKHQIHHRGQMTILMRQAGLKIPGVYGPSKEEWAEYNMQPME
jgi:uncharacterized damage-inducible protein DinB